MTNRVVALTGYAGSGKSTIAEHLERKYGFKRIRFADPLKDMLKVGFGLTDEHVNGALKETGDVRLCGKSPRHAMQTLGTEWGRGLIHRDIWVTAWLDRVVASRSPVVVEDMRFGNEANTVDRLGGFVIRVNRPGHGAGPHVSEQENVSIVPNVTIENAGTVADLRAMVDHLVGG